MTLDILPATYEDMGPLSELFNAAFADDPNMSRFHPHTPQAVLKAADLANYQTAFNAPGRRFWKVVDSDTGRIVAFSKWYFPHDDIYPEEKVPEKWTEGSNEPLMKEFLEKMYAGRNKWIKRDDTYFMNILAVHPDYQRKGLGGRLLEPVLKQADKEGRKTYIEASKKGLGLYKKLGWVEVGDMVIDMRPYGGDANEKTVFLMRDPQPVTE